jgi:uncharacterized protein (TIGR00251 family)
MMAFYRAVPEGISLTVRLTPKSARDSIDGPRRLSDGGEVLQVRVRAPPAENEANAALIALLAKALHVPKSAIVIVSGHSARLKRVKVDGNTEILAKEIERWIEST